MALLEWIKTISKFPELVQEEKRMLGTFSNDQKLAVIGLGATVLTGGGVLTYQQLIIQPAKDLYENLVSEMNADIGKDGNLRKFACL